MLKYIICKIKYKISLKYKPQLRCLYKKGNKTKYNFTKLSIRLVYLQNTHVQATKIKLNARETENPAIQFMEHDNSCLSVWISAQET